MTTSLRWHAAGVLAALVSMAQVPGYEGLKIRTQFSITAPDWRPQLNEFVKSQRTDRSPTDSAHWAADQGSLSATCQRAYRQARAGADQAAVNCAFSRALGAANEAGQERDQEHSIHRVAPSDHAA